MARNKNLPYKCGDVCFLPKQIFPREAEKALKLFISKNRRKILKELNLKPGSSHFFYLDEVKRKYMEGALKFKIFRKLPKEVKNFIATFNAVVREDAYEITQMRAYTNFGYIILEGGTTEDTIRAFGLHRLKDVRQLGSLMDPFHRLGDSTQPALMFEQSRESHSFDVVVMLRKIEMNNPNVPLNRNLLTIGGMSHDGMTPAGGDTTKLINLKLFNEETNYPRLFEKPGWQALKRRYQVTEEELSSMVLGKGLNGKLLDIADKISYISADVWNFVGLKNPYSDNEVYYDNKYYSEISNLIKLYPNFSEVVDSVKITGQDAVFDDGLLWGVNLKIRALMFAGVYYNLASRFPEYMLSKRVTTFLLNSGKIKTEELFSWRDFNLDEKIHEFLGAKFYPMCFEKSVYKKFRTQKDMKREIELLKENPYVVAIPDDFQYATKNGVEKYLVKKNGKVSIFKEAFPEMAAEIEEIMKFSPVFGLHIVDLRELRVPLEKHKTVKRALENF